MNIIDLRHLLYSTLFTKTVALILIFSIFFNPTESFSSIKNTQEIVHLKLISGWEMKDKKLQAAIQFKLSPGWKTYWKSPGPFGVRPSIDWSKSDNIKNIEFLWPTPKIFYQYNATVIGYENTVTIPITITKKSINKSSFLNLDIQFGVCSDICLIKTAEINSPLSFPNPNKNKSLISEAFKRLPSKITDQSFSVSSCSIDKIDDQVTIVYAIILSKKPKSKPAMILDYKFSSNYFENQTIEINKQELIVRAYMNKIHKEEGVIERDRLSAILLLENKGFEITGCG